MTGRSHILIGLASIIAGCSAGWFAPTPCVLLGGVFGSLLPDIDTERSMLGARMKFMARPIAQMFGHRGATHSMLVLIVIVLAIGHWGGMGALHGGWGALCLGYASHILADLPTGGVSLLYPLSRSRIALWPYARTGGIGEVMLLTLILATLLGVAYRGVALPQAMRVDRHVGTYGVSRMHPTTFDVSD